MTIKTNQNTCQNTYEKPILPGMILCAGTSKRFGSDKMLANLAGKPLLAHTIDRVKLQIGALAINADERAKHAYSIFGLPLYFDQFSGQGPLSGILTAMDWAIELGYKRVYTIAGDIPFIPNDWARKLAAVDENKIAVPLSSGKTQQICALWPCRLRDNLFELLTQEGPRNVNAFIKAQPHEYVEFTNDCNTFFNVNTIDDLHHAEQLLSTSD